MTSSRLLQDLVLSLQGGKAGPNCRRALGDARRVVGEEVVQLGRKGLASRFHDLCGTWE